MASSVSGRASPTARRILEATKLDDVIVLGNAEWDQLENILNKHDPHMAAATVTEIKKLWKWAVMECDDEIAEDKKGYVSTIRAPPVPTVPPVTLPVALARKPLKLSNKRLEVSPRIPLRGPEGPSVAEGERVVARKQEELAEALWDRFIELGKCGAAWTGNLEDSSFRLEAQSTLVGEWALCPTLARHLASLEEWVTWAESRHQAWQTPDSVSVRVFLASFAKAGTSVPRRHYDSLRWLQNHIGLRAGTELERVRRMTDPSTTHEPIQARPVMVTVWVALENALASGNVFVNGLALFAVFSILSVSRPKHMQRSVVLSTAPMVEARVFKGKQKVRGRAAPFFWAAPCFGVTGTDVAAHLEAYLKDSGAASEEFPFFLPDFSPKRSDFSSATGFSRQPMSPQKIGRQLLMLLRAIGVREDVIAATDVLYCFRRLFPTLAHRSSYIDMELLDVGGWNDASAKQKHAMPRLYSAAKQEMQFRRKAELVAATRIALTDSFLAKGSPPTPSWDHLFQFWPSRDSAQKAMPGRRVATSVAQAASSSKSAAVVDEEPPSDVAESSDGSSSESAFDDDGEAA